MLPDVSPHDIAETLDRVAARLLRTAGVGRPPVDAFRVAHALGIETAIDAAQAARARYVEWRDPRGGAPHGAILLRPEPRVERRHWAVAHEVGEQQAAEIFLRLSVDPRTAPPTSREWVANQFANRLLLPSRWFARHGESCDWDLPGLKARFSTASHELILRRMLDFPSAVVVSIFDQGRLVFRRSNLAGRLPPLLPAERRCRQAAHFSGHAQSSACGPCTVRAWPIHEAEWKRELLRLDLSDGADEMLAETLGQFDANAEGSADDAWTGDIEPAFDG